MGKLKIVDYKVLDEGVHPIDMYPGRGILPSGNYEWNRVYTGAGVTGDEALDDAVEQAAWSDDWANSEKLEEIYQKERLNMGDDVIGEEDINHKQYYVSLFLLVR